MHKKVFQEFEKICSKRSLRGSVLEVGAKPDFSSLLNMEALKAMDEKIGINLEGASEYKDFKILKGNANNMDCFASNSFDLVLCNAVFEHDKFFWKTLSEIKRVAKPGALIVIGAPGFGITAAEGRLRAILNHIPFLPSFFTSSTLTLLEHNFPGDYYRFNKQAFEQVFFEGMKEVSIKTIMSPPRIIGAGIKS